jgi:hypothetical protein
MAYQFISPSISHIILNGQNNSKNYNIVGNSLPNIWDAPMLMRYKNKS